MYIHMCIYTYTMVTSYIKGAARCILMHPHLHMVVYTSYTPNHRCIMIYMHPRHFLFQITMCLSDSIAICIRTKIYFCESLSLMLPSIVKAENSNHLSHEATEQNCQLVWPENHSVKVQ